MGGHSAEVAHVGGGVVVVAAPKVSVIAAGGGFFYTISLWRLLATLFSHPTLDLVLYVLL